MGGWSVSMETKGLKTYLAWYGDKGTGTRFRVLVDALDIDEARSLLERDGMNVLCIRRRSVVWMRRGMLAGIALVLMVFSGLVVHNIKDRAEQNSQTRTVAQPLWERKAYFSNPYLTEPRREAAGNQALQATIEAQAGIDPETKKAEEEQKSKQALNLLDVMGGN